MDAVFGTVPIEAVRSYWNGRPSDIRHSERRVGEAGYYVDVERRRYFVLGHIPRFAQFERWKAKRVLDVGCGIGTDALNFARAGAHVTAVELSDRSLDIARRGASAAGIENIRFVQANAERLRESLPVLPYDLVYAFGMLHHTPRPARALAELVRYVAPGGTLKVMLYHRFSWRVAQILFTRGKGAWWKRDALIARWSEAQRGCPVTYAFSRSQARRLVEEAGFEIEELQVDHVFPWRRADYERYRYVRLWYLRWLPKRAFRWFEHNFGWHICITARKR